jgi:hypothetical protein
MKKILCIFFLLLSSSILIGEDKVKEENFKKSFDLFKMTFNKTDFHILSVKQESDNKPKEPEKKKESEEKKEPEGKKKDIKPNEIYEDENGLIRRKSTDGRGDWYMSQDGSRWFRYLNDSFKENVPTNIPNQSAVPKNSYVPNSIYFDPYCVNGR